MEYKKIAHIDIKVDSCYGCPYLRFTDGAPVCGAEAWRKLPENWNKSIPDWCPFLNKEVQDD